MKVNNLKYKDLNRRDAEIAMFRGILVEVYYLLKDRGGKGIDDAMFHIEKFLPYIKNYKYT